ncbi:FAD/NAD(P)-binding protein [Nocardiopsis sp. L17-MgMaSL7]|uniref:FAD/NAD(P)-binding protein n=1 Tax=Nocardiopsis sp. L17-MgMaSL7 TaxID=1938893 RepID=UPI000D7122B0|nr:FAD/NAD(P)-binding domain-containing protein [Nocardiopsis sp. L17-MgMaSL7]PWV55136.1 FAD-NAD(P)-binding protein [Nocardiopsis sp. L17-MgMaSL7]
MSGTQDTGAPARDDLARSAGHGAQERFDAVVVGGGPRAVAVVVRLAARLGGGERPVRVAVVDRVEVGAGATWRTDQSPLLLNNTYSAHTTIHADESTRMDGPVVPGPDLVRWASDGRVPADRPEWAAREIAELRPWSFPSRRLQGVYYDEQLADAVATGRVEVTPVLGTAVDLESAGSGWRTVVLEDGRRLAAPSVVLAQGMVQTRRSPRVRSLAAAAERHGLVYVEPGMPAERAWDRVPGGETVLVAGLGANFFDVVALLTQGRGGRFVPAGDPARPSRLRYLPGGDEPLLVAGSRRGLPYRAKAAYADGFPPGYEPVLATREWFARVAAASSQDFRTAVWPQLAREFAWAHLSVLLEHRPEAVREGLGRGELLSALEEADADGVDAVVAEAVSDPRLRLRTGRLDRPSPPTGGAPLSEEEWRAEVARFAEAELETIDAPERSPRNAVNRAMAALRGPVQRLVGLGALDGASVARDVAGWFTPLGLALASGPPPHRAAQVLALIDAGVVELLGEGSSVEFEDGLFVGRSTSVRRAPVWARAFVETRMSKGVVTDTDDPLLRTLLGSGRARLHRWPASDGPAVSSGTLDVTREGFHLVGDDGAADEHVTVLGIPAGAVQPGSAIGATPGVPSPLLAGADVAAAGILAARASLGTGDAVAARG